MWIGETSCSHHISHHNPSERRLGFQSCRISGKESGTNDAFNCNMCYSQKKLTCPLKNDGWKTIFLLEWLPFSGYIDIYIYMYFFFFGGGTHLNTRSNWIIIIKEIKRIQKVNV